MKKWLKQLTFLLMTASFVGWGAAQTPEAPKTLNDYYQSALQSYLTGDFDQAILWDSKALQLDPQDKKANDLLAILVSEKDTANQTVIWIGGKPTVVEKAAPPPAPVPQLPVTVYQEKTVSSPPSNGKKMAELEARVQTVALLMERDSFSQYRELSGAQAQTTKRLDEISFNLKGLNWGILATDILFLLALAVAGVALWKSWKNGLEIKKQTQAWAQSFQHEDRGRVVKIHRM